MSVGIISISIIIIIIIIIMVIIVCFDHHRHFIFNFIIVFITMNIIYMHYFILTKCYTGLRQNQILFSIQQSFL